MFNEIVTVIPFAGGGYINPHEGIPGYQRIVAGTPGWSLRCGHLYEPKSKIIQADGTAWEVIQCYDAAPDVRVAAKLVAR